MPDGGSWKELIKACIEGNLILIEFHLKNGIDPNFQHAEYFSSPLCSAIQSPFYKDNQTEQDDETLVQVIQLLLKYGADPDLEEDYSSDTPAELAVKHRHWKALKVLQAACRDPLPLQQVAIVFCRSGGGWLDHDDPVVEYKCARQLLLQGHKVTIVWPSSSAEGMVPTSTSLLGVQERLGQDTGRDVMDIDVVQLPTNVSVHGGDEEGGGLSETNQLIQQLKKTTVDTLIVNAASGWALEKRIIQSTRLESSFQQNVVVPALWCRAFPNARRVLMLDHRRRRHHRNGRKKEETAERDYSHLASGRKFSPWSTFHETQECVIDTLILPPQAANHRNVVVGLHLPDAWLSVEQDKNSSSCWHRLTRKMLAFATTRSVKFPVSAIVGEERLRGKLFHDDGSVFLEDEPIATRPTSSQSWLGDVVETAQAHERRSMARI